MADDATTFTFLNAITTAAAGSSFDCSRVEGLQIHFWSAAGSSSTVLIQGSENGSIWITLGTVTNVALAGEVWEGACMKYMRVNPTVVGSGTISALGHALDSNPGAWHKITQASTTPVALSAAALTMASATVSDLTITRVPYASTAGLLIDDSTFNFTTATKVLAATYVKSNHIMAVAAKLTDGAISAVPQTLFITKGSALGSSTVANPTATDHDGYCINIVSTTGYAHVVSFNSGKINGGSLTTATFGAQIGNTLSIVAYQGVWYAVGNIGVTIS